MVFKKRMLGEGYQILPGHNEKGQGPLRRPGPAAHAGLGDVPQVHGRHGDDPGRGGDFEG